MNRSALHRRDAGRRHDRRIDPVVPAASRGSLVALSRPKDRP